MIPGFYRLYQTNIAHINRLFEILFGRAQAVQKKVWTTAPSVNDLEEKEFAPYDDGTNQRIYYKLDGKLYYWDLTSA